MFPILNPPPSSLPIPSLWIIPVHQPQASSIVHRMLISISQLSQNCLLLPTFHQCPCSTHYDLLPELGPLRGSPTTTPAALQWFIFHDQSYCLGDKFDHLMSILKIELSGWIPVPCRIKFQNLAGTQRLPPPS